MIDADDVFSGDGLLYALHHGIEPAVMIGSLLSGLTVSLTDFYCGRCNSPIDVPARHTGRFLVCNSILNDGLCRRCASD